MRIFLVLLALLVRAQSARAQQEPGFVHEVWTTRDGLPVNAITHVLQSRTGYIWVATFDGLARFDGVRFTVFNTGNSPGLPTNRITRLYESSDTTLWLVTEQQQLLSFRHDRFKVIAGSEGMLWDNNRWQEDRTGRLWVASERGVFIIRRDSLVAVAPGVITSASTIAVGPDGTLWVAGEPSGVYRVRSDSVVELPGVRPPSGAPIRAMVANDQGPVWIGANDAVYRYPSMKVALRGPLIYEQPADGDELFTASPGGIHRLRRNGEIERISNDESVHATSTSSGTLYTTSLNAGYGRKSGLHRNGRFLGKLPASFDSVRIVTMAVDHEGSIWVGTTAQGLQRLKPGLFTTFDHGRGLPDPNIYSVASDRTGALWTLSGDRATRIADGRVAVFAAIQQYTASAIIEDRHGQLWFGDLACTPPAMHCARDPASPVRSPVRAIFNDADGTLWFGTENGLFTLRNGAWSLLRNDLTVRAFARTPDGAMWMATNGRGIFRFQDDRFQQLTAANGLPSDLVRSLYVDGDGVLWIGTEGNGLARIEPPSTQRIVTIKREHGLYDDGIHEILEDDFGRLWMSTNRGIFWVPRSELNDFALGKVSRVRSTSYTERHGLRNREFNGGTQHAGAKTPDGRLWFATQAGIVVVDPRTVSRNRATPNVVIEQVTRGGDRLRDMTIEYTALSLLAPENVRFRYRLENYDPDWIDADTRRTAFYTRVPPGSYTFRVIASNDADVWNEVGATLPISIAPLFYETTWFKLLLFASAGLLVLLAMRYRLRQVRIAAEAQQLRELDRAKSRFFANVSHEFRTPLTLTIGPLEDARADLAGKGEDEAISRIDMALRSARRLFTLVTQVLDVAKLEAGSMKLHLRPGDIATFTRGVCSSFEDLAERRRIHFELVASQSVIAAFDADALEKILTNLLSNAFKFTPDGGRISVTVAQHEVAMVRVADSGSGIPAKDLPHVFERFYQVDETNTRAEVGTGIGLSLAQELIALHHGTIRVDSGPSGGATFTISLPLAAQASATQQLGHEPDDVTTLLVVDDSADMRAYVRSRFEKRYRVLEAANGADGIAVARAELPDLIISDVMMPGTDGHHLVASLRSSAETDYLPIILLTAQAESEQRIAGLERGADDYITKPFDMRELEARVGNLIASHQRLRERFSNAGAPIALEPEPPAATSHAPADRAFLDRLTSALETNLASPDFGVAELAAAVFMDRTNLFRRTRELLDESPSELLRRVRLERAAKLLAEGEDGIADIAYGVGFNSVSAFGRAFRETYSTTPAAYRNSRTASRR